MKKKKCPTGYPAESAGCVMTKKYISLKKDMTVAEALKKIGADTKKDETIYTLFVVDSSEKLEGVLTLKDLLIAQGTTDTIGKTNGKTLIGDIMSSNAIRVLVDTDQEEVAKTLQEFDLFAVPVVDEDERLVGIITIDEAIDILEDETTEDILDQAGLADIAGDESDRSEVLIKGSLWKIWKVRLPFLLATLGLGMVSGLVIDIFEGTLEAVIGVAVFIPVIMGMGGNIGTQSSTIFTRGVVLNHIQIKNFIRPFLKEMGVGLSIGSLVGVISGIIATFWLKMPMLGLAVGLAMVITMTIATSLGFLVPYILIKLKADQAAGSAPIITTIKDLVALIVYFVCVSLFLGLG